MKKISLVFALALVWAGAAFGFEELDDGTAVEGCVGCHASGEVLPVSNVTRPGDAHYTDLDPRGPATPSGYRRLVIEPTSVDVGGTSVVVEFRASDGDGEDVDVLFESDGRVAIARLVAGSLGEPSEWQAIIQSERFTVGGFEALGGGQYRYTTTFDPTSVPIVAGETLRVALQISAGDIPAANGWCDFDASLSAPNDCDGPVSVTRDIVQTETCNECHGATSDTRLSFHGGGRTEVEYCVVCHNPGIGETDMTNLTHKIHYGAELTMGFRRWSDVRFTRDLDDCAGCHAGAGADVDNWKTEPNRTACGSCHDDVNFDTGENHGSGGVQPTNQFCRNCHPPAGPLDGFVLPVETVHQGGARTAEAALYRGAGDGFFIDAAWDRLADELTIDYSVTRDGAKASLQSDAEWMAGARLAIQLAWATSEYTNDGSGSDPAPAQPVSIDALDVGGAVTDLGNGTYRAVVPVPSGAADSVAVVLEGHPVADVADTGIFSSIPVRDAVDFVSVETRGTAAARRAIVDIDKCNACHDSAGAGLTLHGTNRTGEPQSCVTCHNPNATDLRRRPADPGSTLDGKREETIDMKHMIHRIHAGENLQDGYVLYGFGGRPHDYSNVGFIGNDANCLTCHLPGTYAAEDAWLSAPTTVHSGEDVTDPSDDLNISSTSSVCSSCHDADRAKRHMVLNGGSFGALPENILIIAAPEPSTATAGLFALGSVAALRRLRRRRR